MRWTIAQMLKLALIVCILLALLAMLFHTDAFTAYFFDALRALFDAVMPCVIVIGGLWMLMRVLFH